MNSRSVTKRYTKIVVVFAVTAILFVLLQISRPIWLQQFLNVVGISAAWENNVSLVFHNKQEMQVELDLLRNIVQERNAALILAEYNRAALLDVYRDIGEEGGHIVRDVLLRPPYSAYDQYVIEGADPLWAENKQVVVAHGQYVIGYVQEVMNRHSRVQLFSAPGEEFLVSIEGILYPAVGEGGGTISITLPRNFRDTQRVVVTVPGTAPYVLGFLENTSFEPQDSYVRGIMNLPVNIFEQEQVVVAPVSYISQEIISQESSDEEEQ